MRFTPYPAEIESAMHLFYVSLSERDRRRYAAVEAVKLGHGGLLYLAHLFGCSERTIRHGLDELHEPPVLPFGRARKKGGDANAVLTPSKDWKRTFRRSCATTRPATRCARKSSGPISR